MTTTAQPKQRSIRFPRKPIEQESIVGTALRWYSRCGRYRITRFERYSGGVERFYVEVSALAGDGRWRHVPGHRSPCRKLQSAITVCLVHARLESRSDP